MKKLHDIWMSIKLAATMLVLMIRMKILAWQMQRQAA